MIENFIRERITQLRLSKGLSEYQVSLDLGHNKSYINNIVLGKSLPSLSELLYMCAYFGITPKDFFDDSVTNPMDIQKLIDGAKKVKSENLCLLIELIDCMHDNESVKKQF